LRYLSHIETIRVFQRAIARADIKVRHSQGFNPRPKLSFVLPRSVALECDQDLLFLQIESTLDDFDPDGFKTQLSQQIPEGCEIISLTVSEKKPSLQVASTNYEMPIKSEFLNQELTNRVEIILSSEDIIIERRGDGKARAKHINVRPFLQSVKINDDKILVECNISQTGTIRIDEILELLDLSEDKMAAPVKRTRINLKYA